MKFGKNLRGLALAAALYACFAAKELKAQTTNVPVSVTNDATLTWLWATQYLVRASSAGNGYVSGHTNEWVDEGSNATLEAIADNYHHFDSWSGDASGNSNPMTFSVDKPYTNIIANFKQNLAANKTPEYWLNEKLGITNNFDQAETNDNDGDLYLNWEEYQCGTDPTNNDSFMQPTTITMGSPIEIVVNCSSTGEYTSPDCRYSVEKKTNLVEELDWNEINSSSGLGNQKIVFIPDAAGDAGFYRVKARRKE